MTTEQDIRNEIEELNSLYNRAIKKQSGTRFALFNQLEKTETKLDGYLLAQSEAQTDLKKKVEMLKERINYISDFAGDNRQKNSLWKKRTMFLKNEVDRIFGDDLKEGGENALNQYKGGN